ncbi:signal peptidase II [Bifidobacterium aemilianum]
MNERPRRLRDRVVVFAVLVALALAVDQVSKACAQIALADGRSLPLIPGLLSLKLLRNPGASLGLGASQTWLISLLALAACIALVGLVIRTDSMVWTLTFSLAFSGAAGNLLDRMAYADGFLNGRVVDFLDYGWSIGNIADIYLMLAGIAIVLLIALGKPLRAPEPTGGSGLDDLTSGRDQAGAVQSTPGRQGRV